ncbi:MAG: hypothetical protein Kow00127_14290 [Bacteroidales bacterium]
MRKLLSYSLLIGFTGMFLFSSCTKEGPAGPPGKDGEDGIDGQDGTATCIQCHDDSQMLFAKSVQWEASTHATGGNFERSEGECAICHTSQGFRGNIDGSYNYEEEGAAISNPNPPNCYTCHQIHSTYTTADLALTWTDPVEIRNSGKQTFDFGDANICAMCHQGRTLDPFPVAGGDDVQVTSPYWGIHHGPQANMISTLGVFDPGTGTLPTGHPHNTSIEDACVTCHMAEAYGAQSGGHTMNMTYEYHGSETLNTAGCVTCHTDTEELVADVEQLQGEIEALLTELKTLLDAEGITVEGSDNAVPGTYPANVAGAFVNYKACLEDGSYGVHNPTFIKKLLENTIDLLQ